jgi:hypothetical protein
MARDKHWCKIRGRTAGMSPCRQETRHGSIAGISGGLLGLERDDFSSKRHRALAYWYRYSDPASPPTWPVPLLCRFSDAGMRRLSTRCGGRRPKSAKARSRGKLGTGWQRVLWGLYERGHCQAPFFLAFALSFVRPRRRLSSAPTADFGRRRAQKLSRSAVALP